MAIPVPNELEPFDPDPVIASVLRGETDQYRQIVSTYSPHVRYFLGARLQHREDTEDLAQSIFLIAFEKLGSYQSGSSFRAWLLGIARFELNNHLRKVGRRGTAMERFRIEMLTLLSPELEEKDDDFRHGRLERLRECISRLSKRSKEIVEAGLEGLQAEALGEKLGMTPDAIYSARYRVNATLRRCIEEGERGLPTRRDE